MLGMLRDLGHAVVLLLLFIWTCEAYETYVPQEQELRARLLRKYDRTTLPARTTQLRLRRLTIKHFDINEENHSLDVDAWLVYEWTDPRLEYMAVNGIEKLSMAPQDIWMPDLRLYNSAKAGEAPYLDDTLTLVYPDGRVLYAPPAKLHTTCVVDLTYWPHDTHNCSIILGSWVHHGHTLDLRLLHEEPKVDMPWRESRTGGNLTRGEWQLVEATIRRRQNTYECCPEPYVSIWITLLLRRYAPAFAWLVKLPAAGLSVMTFVLFVLPPGAGEKVVFGLLCLILDVIFIAYTSQVVAHAPSHTPLIVQLVCEQVVVVVVGVVVSGVVVRMVHDPHSEGVPSWLKRPLSLVASCLCLSHYNNLVAGFRRTLPHSLKSDELELGTTPLGSSAHPNETTIRNEWLFLAAVVDRVCLVLYVFLFIVNLIRYHSVL